MVQSTPGLRPARLVWAVGWVAAAILGFEISLMRILSVASYHHFAFLVITIVLLGFGASGSILFVARRWTVPRGEPLIFTLALLTAVSIPVCSAIIQHIPVEARILPATLGRQLAYWIFYWAVLTVPFLVGAGTLGLALMIAEGMVARVYAANLIGSAAGALVAPLAMLVVPPAWLPPVMGGIAFLGAAGCWPVGRFYPPVSFTGAALLVTLVVLADPPSIRVDEFKDIAYLERLRNQGAAKRVARSYGPRGVISAYQSDVLHDLPFLSGGGTPPPVTAIVLDGHRAGSVLDVAGVEEAGVVEHTLMALPYELAPTSPRVLLLGEIGGANTWLALRRRAAEVRVVQPHDRIVELLRGPLRDFGGTVLDQPSVGTTTAEPRHFVEHTPERFDLIQLVTLESQPAGSAGLGGLAEDHLITVDGISAALKRLKEGGVLTATRGIQTPPRDNLKLLITFVAALREQGMTSPERHIVIVRDFLAVCTVVSRRPWKPEDIEGLRQVIRERQLTPVWFEGMRRDELNQPDQLPAAPDGVGDWYHYAARQIFSNKCEPFIEGWPFDIRAPTDNRPFFHDFGRLTSIGRLRQVFGDTWLTRAELGFVFVVAAALLVAVVGAVATLLPLGMVRSAHHGAGRTATVAYFAAIGLAYLILEMTYLSRLTYLIGDPVFAAALTIAGFLAMSGLGSLTAQRTGRGGTRWLCCAAAGIVLIGAVELVSLMWGASAAGDWSAPLRCLVALAVIAPVGYFMGFPMPLALQRLERHAPALIPWAWGINGYASVLAAPLATLIAMTWGFHVAGAAALVLYATTLALYGRLPGQRPAIPGNADLP